MAAQYILKAKKNDRPMLKDIVNFVVPDVHHKWYVLGLQLLEDPRDEAFLQGLMDQYPNTSDRCREVFRRWLDSNTKATWSMIMGALNERCVNLPNVSHNIESMLDKHNIIKRGARNKLKLSKLFKAKNQLTFIPPIDENHQISSSDTDEEKDLCEEQTMDIEQAELLSKEVDKVAEYYSRTAVGNRKIHEYDILASLFNQLTKLKTLNVHGCNISDKGNELIVAVLSKTISLEIFNISNSNLNTIKTTEMVRVLKNVSSVRSLNLSSNAICEEATSDIAQFLYNNPVLAELNLSNNKISTGVLHIANALPKSNSIKLLDISKNHITDDCIENVAAALAQCLTLEGLNMSNNLLTFTSIVKVAEGLRGHCNLQILNLSNNLTSFHSEGEFFVDVILSTNRSLVYLNVCGRNIRPRFTNNHFFPPPGTELTSARFLLQNLYLSRSPSFEMLTFKGTPMDIPDKFVKATEESCSVFDQNIASYYVDHNGGTIYYQDHDFAIVVPPGAVSQGECIEIKATASFFGHYQFPDECHPVSSFFSISCNYTFKIPVYLIMSHFAAIKDVNDINSLCVLQAPACIQNQEKLKMKEVLNGVYFDLEIRYCLLATQHFSSFNAQDKSNGTLTEKFNVLCYDCEDMNCDEEAYATEVCFCTDNRECREMIKWQCSEIKHGKMSPSTYNLFDFDKGQSLHIPDDFSKIDGWSVDLNSVVEVPYDSFEYWNIYNNDEELEKAKVDCAYPPRLQILYYRIDPSVNLDYRFHVKKIEEDGKSKPVAVFPLFKMAKVKRQKINASDTPTKPSTDKLLDSEAEMGDLIEIVMPKIQAEWEEVAFVLRFKIPEVNNIKEKCNGDPRKCCRTLFIEWLQGRGIGPKTWATLLDKLNKIPQLVAVTEEIKQELLNLSQNVA